jgi:tRNA 2-thiouridine synthesizing protein A
VESKSRAHAGEIDILLRLSGLAYEKGGCAHHRREWNSEMVAQTLDTKGMNCPLPILKAKKAIADLKAGEVLEVLATDPGSVKDFEAFSRATGNELMESSEEGGVFRYLIKKSG